MKLTSENHAKCYERKRNMIKRILSILSAIIMIIGMLSGVAFAGPSRGMAMYRGASVIQAGDIICFGNYDGKPIEWYVLSTDESSESILLLSRNCLYKSKFSDESNSWENSIIRNGLSNFATTAFNPTEYEAINSSTIITSGSSSTDKLFLLSKDEVNSIDQDILRINDEWWLRSPGNNGKAARVTANGSIDETYVRNEFIGVRPAFSLLTKSVLFTMRASGMSTGEVGEYTGNTWKLTLGSYEIPNPEIESVTRNGNTLEVAYKAVTTGDNMALSYCILDNTGDGIRYYDHVSAKSESSGTITIPLPDGITEGDRIIFFAEQINGDKKTDFAGEFTEKTIPPASTSWTVTNGTKQEDQAQNNGYLTINKTTADAGDPVIITVKPNDGYQLKQGSLNVSRTGDTATTVIVAQQSESTYQFTMPDYAVTVTAEFEKVASVLTGISVSKEPDKMVYTEGETFDSTGMIVTAAYSDESSKDVTGYTVTPSGVLTTMDASAEIRYTENGVTKSVMLYGIKVNPAHKAEYTIIKGANQTIYTNAESAVFVSDADVSKFVGIQIDGRPIASSNLKVESGSTKVTLNRKIIKSLKVGQHTLTIRSTDGEAGTAFTVAEPLPKTGDGTNLALLLMLLLASAGAIILISARARKRN